jgi:crotonobetainyl-CoA:carnitine CoA-transferase CaiB-like acyl-CoA transferase
VTETVMIAKALSGIRVVDLSRILAGPWCTQNLADLGAEVIKIEKPGSGDDTRGWGPPYMEGADGQSMSAYFMCCNRGKQSVCLDFKTDAGRAQLLELIRDADVLVENYRAGTLKRYQLDYESLRAVNPRLVYASITGYGQTGPKAHRPGYDYIFQGLGGLMSYTGHEARCAPVWPWWTSPQAWMQPRRFWRRFSSVSGRVRALFWTWRCLTWPWR